MVCASEVRGIPHKARATVVAIRTFVLTVHSHLDGVEWIILAGGIRCPS